MGLRSRRRQTPWIRPLILCALLFSLGVLVFQVIQSKTNAPFKPLLPGDTIPASLTYITADEQALTLIESAHTNPLVLVYYRGGFCNYCVAHLNELNQVNTAIQAAGYQLIAVSQDPPDILAKTKEAHGLTYQLVSDPALTGAKHFGIQHKESGRLLPHPSVFVINTRGVIVFAHTDTNYKKRLATDALLGVL